MEQQGLERLESIHYTKTFYRRTVLHLLPQSLEITKVPVLFYSVTQVVAGTVTTIDGLFSVFGPAITCKLVCKLLIHKQLTHDALPSILLCF